ncbi:DUF488 family protein [Sporomusa malonica]|uniref:DUF488 domain-containing protein n=1 Tax=Sporomusa malonica TaxID=112901 RepID=A0A1W2F2E1_9FIRM|nr:DUF488 domain-containing protein [Sporomusa malonica]SMD16127.1 Protein of unknown function, DUF488 [Sporomusa malonica]
MKNAKKIYTLGHSTVSSAFFLSIIQKFGISCIVDVRSIPYSRHAPQYNKDELNRFLKRNSIQYVFMGDEFGARRDDQGLYSPLGYLDFERTRKSGLFLRGIERLNKGVETGFTIALMCTEKRAIDCHRSILVGKGLTDVGFEVVHIDHDSKTMTQHEMEQVLLKAYFPEVNMFADQLGEPLNEKAMIEEAYRHKNREIGFVGYEEKEAAHS